MLETGDAVKPKTGGPVMRIESYNPTNGKLVCQWIEDSNVKREEFASSELMLPIRMNSSMRTANSVQMPHS